MTYLPRLIRILNVVAKFRLDEFLRGRRRLRLLQLLQDQVPPFEQPSITDLTSDLLGMRASEVFAELESEALASASVAQVHAAVLKSGEEVVVKVIRPGVGETIGEDIGLLKRIAAMIDRNFSAGRRLRIVEVGRDYEKRQAPRVCGRISRIRTCYMCRRSSANTAAAN